jgi:hypothetical protein
MAFEAAPNLEMLRLVFEDPGLFDGYSPHTALTDATLSAVARYCPNLKILALSKTNGMTSEGFNYVLNLGNLKILDFHRYLLN